jgi:hypothetical protein
MNMERAIEYLSKGAEALQARRHAEALSHFQAADAYNPNLLDVKIGLATTLAYAQQFRESLRVLEPFVLQHPPIPEIRLLQRKILAACPPPALRMWSLDRVTTAAHYLETRPLRGSARALPLGGGEVPQSSLTYYLLDDIAVLGTRAMLVTPDGRILRESTPDENVEAAIFPVEIREARLGRERLRKGEFVALYAVWSDGFYHWVMEQLPRVLMAEQLGFTGTYIVPQGAPFILESLQLLGIADERVEVFDGGDWRAERLWVLEPFAGHTLRQHPGATALLREAFLARLPAGGSSGPQRVYVSRRDPNRPRRVVNETALEALLGPYGFVTVDFATMSFAEQISAAASATALLGPHGAGIIHSLFMPPKSLLIELVSPTYINPVGMIPAGFLRHRYHLIPSYLNNCTYQFGEDIEAFLMFIQLTLDVELGTP